MRRRQITSPEYLILLIRPDLIYSRNSHSRVHRRLGYFFLRILFRKKRLNDLRRDDIIANSDFSCDMALFEDDR